MSIGGVTDRQVDASQYRFREPSVANFDIYALSGFTMVELLVTITVAIVLVTVAVPDFRYLRLSHALTTRADDIATTLKVARIAAIERNAEVQFCGNDRSANGSDKLSQACNGHAGAIYTLVQHQGYQLQAALRQRADDIRFNGHLQAVRFAGDGLGHSPVPGSSDTDDEVIADICTPAFDKNNHRMVQIKTGSVIQVDTKSDPVCQ